MFQTTREILNDSEILFEFREEHSHAVQRRVYGNRESFAEFDYILIVDDEITTGNTALNFIYGLNRAGINSRFGIASICNWQSDEEHKKFCESGIDLFYLLSGRIRNINQKMSIAERFPQTELSGENSEWIELINAAIPIRERLAHRSNRDLSSAFTAIDSLKLKEQTVRIIGTEEFMYVPIRVAEYLENLGFNVICHSTTRSPIDVISHTSNGIQSKIEIPSVYDRNRVTYLYNFEEHTDIAILITDADSNVDFSRFKNLLNCRRFIVLHVAEGK